jgi:hypothetical protein
VVGGGGGVERGGQCRFGDCDREGSEGRSAGV